MKLAVGTVKLIVIVHVMRINPTSTHLHGLRPFLVHAIALFLVDLRTKGCSVGTIYVFQFVEFLPDTNSEASGNRRAESGGFVHSGSLDGDLANVGLGLYELA